MISRAYRERDGREVEYQLEWHWAPEIPASRLEPAEGGVIPELVRLDGEWIDDDAVPGDVWDELVMDAWGYMRRCA